MHSAHKICPINSSFFTPIHLYLILLAVFAFAFVFFCYKLGKEIRSVLRRVIFIAIFSFLFVVIGGIVTLVVFIFFDMNNYPLTAYYHDLNAQIKNFCWLDKTRKYCPKTAAELFIAAPDSVRNRLKTDHVTYSYNIQTNQYTLIVRTNDLNEGGALFDSRLPYATSYGYNTPGHLGVDFFDVDIVSNCDGTYRITNPPPLPGPWKQVY